jgi:hypothetical protein
LEGNNRLALVLRVKSSIKTLPIPFRECALTLWQHVAGKERFDLRSYTLL